MAWIEVHQALVDHRKVLGVAERVGVPDVQVIGHLICLWTWAVDSCPDGRLDVSDRIVERAARWTGEPGALMRALVAVELVDATADGMVIHDWDDYAGRLADRRAANAARMREVRRAKKQAATAAPGPGNSGGKRALHANARGENVQRTQTHAPNGVATVDGTFGTRATHVLNTDPETLKSDLILPDVQRTCDARVQHVENTCDERAGATVPYPTVPIDSVSLRSTGTDSADAPPVPSKKPTPIRPVSLEPAVSEPFRLLQILTAETGFGATGITDREKGKQLKTAKRLLDDGYSEDDVRGCVRYLAGETWRQTIVDLILVESQIGKWVAGGRPAAPKPRGGSGLAHAIDGTDWAAVKAQMEA